MALHCLLLGWVKILVQVCDSGIIPITQMYIIMGVVFSLVNLDDGLVGKCSALVGSVLVGVSLSGFLFW